jgi:hypothetical protein
VNWRGLPEASRAEFDALFGPPRDEQEATLGDRPARRLEYVDAESAGLIAWERAGRVVMIESTVRPPVSVIAELPAPSAVLAHEILIPGAYAHEYLYCPTGLVLTVSQSLERNGTERIVRLRGVAPLARVEDFGPAYYRPFDDQVQWSDLDGEGA